MAKRITQLFGKLLVLLSERVVKVVLDDGPNPLLLVATTEKE